MLSNLTPVPGIYLAPQRDKLNSEQNKYFFSSSPSGCPPTSKKVPRPKWDTRPKNKSRGHVNIVVVVVEIDEKERSWSG